MYFWKPCSRSYSNGFVTWLQSIFSVDGSDTLSLIPGVVFPDKLTIEEVASQLKSWRQNAKDWHSFFFSNKNGRYSARRRMKLKQASCLYVSRCKRSDNLFGMCLWMSFLHFLFLCLLGCLPNFQHISGWSSVLFSFLSIHLFIWSLFYCLFYVDMIVFMHYFIKVMDKIFIYFPIERQFC